MNGLRADTTASNALDLSQGFYLSLRASGRLPTTITTYSRVLTALARFRVEMGMPAPASLSGEHLRHYFTSMYDKGNRPATVSVHYRSLSSFYKWLVSEGEIRESPLLRLKPPRPESRILDHYTPASVERLLADVTASKDILCQRDGAIILLLFDTGLRASELCGLKRSDMDLRTLTLKVLGKGNKERLVGVGYTAARALERYLRRRTDSVPWLFTSWHGAQLTFNALSIMLRRRFKTAGLDKTT